MAALICGSLAFDTIMNFEGRFGDQILADQIHKLNVSFLVPGLRREFGGCAGNIAYGLKRLGGTPLPMATVGTDGPEYIQRMDALGISTQYVRQVDGSMTAQAMIMTDRDNNQITAFHPGAMMQAHTTRIGADTRAALAIVSPDGRDAMIEHATQLAAARIPFLFDPGQGLPMFGKPELTQFVAQATWVTVNDYEAEMLCERIGQSLADISKQVQGLVVTLGAKGCQVWIDGECQTIAPVQADAELDPTGCGDAFRAALLFGLEKAWSLARCCELGNQMGAIKIASLGGQNYDLSKLSFDLS
jgi:adenosine kinase